MRQVQTYPMKNGMTLYYGAANAVNLAGVGVRVGSLYDPKGKEGMAHFAEHMLTRKSRRHSAEQVKRIMRRYLGGKHDGDIDICTTRSCTYFGHLDLLRRRYQLEAFPMMAGFVHPKTRILEIDGASVEFSAVHNEYCQNGVDLMDMLLEDSVHEILYTRNPARGRIDFRPEQWESLTDPEIMVATRGFVRKWYVPSNMFAIFLGSDFKTAKKFADQYFGDLEPSSEPVLEYDKSEPLPKLKEIRSLEIVRDIKQYYLGVAFPTEGYMTEDGEALDMLARILDERLEDRLRENNHERRKGIYHPHVDPIRTFCHGLFFIHFATLGDRDYLRFAEDVILDELKKFKRELVSPEEFETLDRVRDEYDDMFWNTPNRLVSEIREAASNGDLELKYLNDFRRSLRRINRRKLRDVANKYFTSDYVRVVISPSKETK